MARQITEAFPWDKAPTYIVRDNDRAFGNVFTRRIQAIGIRDRPTSFRSPWQNGHVERVRSKNHIRTYWWCSPDKIGMTVMRPDRWTIRRNGASFWSARWVRAWL